MSAAHRLPWPAARSVLPVPYTGIHGETVTDISQRLQAQHGGLPGLFHMETGELARVRGLCDA